MSGKRSQAKGANGERELCALLQSNGYPVQRGGSQTYGTVPDICGLPGIHIEVKRVERLNIYTAFEQSSRDAEKFNDGVPAVFHRKNRSPWLVTLPLEAWISMYNAWNSNILFREVLK